MSKTFLQYDARWGKKKYPSGHYTVAGSGCGLCACTSIIVNNPKYKNYDPRNVRPYMVKNGFATKGHGTTWEGIRKTLEHYGFDVKRHYDNDKEFLKYMLKGDRWGIILFGAGTKGGIEWTSNGHYMSATDIQKRNGRHYLYMRDSGKRGHTNWYCYETKMRGLIKQTWTAHL